MCYMQPRYREGVLAESLGQVFIDVSAVVVTVIVEVEFRDKAGHPTQVYQSI